MKTIKRTKCELNGKNDLEILYTFKGFPVYMSCLGNDKKDDIHSDMIWAISKSSGLVQLKELIPLEILYPENHSSGTVGQLWNKHHHRFSNFLSRFKPRRVIEIGGAHGILSKKYMKNNKVDWTIVEPNPIPEKGVRARFIKSYFDETFTFEDDYDTIIHSHVFEHIYHPDTFVKHLSDFMKDGKKLIFSIPNMQVMLERKYTNCVNFEHTIFLKEPYIEYLLAKHRFRIDKKEYFMDDHSIFYCAVKDSTVSPIELDNGLYDKNKKLFLDYVKYQQNLVDDLNENMEQTNSPIYLFGAHVFAQYLINFGLDTQKIEDILDNDPQKQGKRLYGTSLMVESPKVLKSIDNPIVILKAGVYNDEIKKDILENINPDAEFWE